MLEHVCKNQIITAETVCVPAPEGYHNATYVDHFGGV